MNFSDFCMHYKLAELLTIASKQGLVANVCTSVAQIAHLQICTIKQPGLLSKNRFIAKGSGKHYLLHKIYTPSFIPPGIIPLGIKYPPPYYIGLIIPPVILPWLYSPEIIVSPKPKVYAGWRGKRYIFGNLASQKNTPVY